VRLNKVSYLCIVNLNILIMVQGKKQLSSKPKFAEVVISDNEAKEMRESANARNRRNPYLKLSYPNGVTLILPAGISIEQLRDYISITV
jgi:hypothetical protein